MTGRRPEHLLAAYETEAMFGSPAYDIGEEALHEIQMDQAPQAQHLEGNMMSASLLP